VLAVVGVVVDGGDAADGLPVAPGQEQAI